MQAQVKTPSIKLQVFSEAVNLTGISVTKLDGTAKGGVVFNIAQNTDIPIRFIGVGEGIDDLQPFKPKDFVDALLEKRRMMAKAVSTNYHPPSFFT